MLRAMRRLMLLRHAKSDWSSPGMPDRDRPLNARGIADARTMNVYFARHALIPNHVLCSTGEANPADHGRDRQGMAEGDRDQLRRPPLRGDAGDHRVAHPDDATRGPRTARDRPQSRNARGRAGAGRGGRRRAPREAHREISDRGAGGDRFSDRRLDQAPSRVRRLDRYVTPKAIAAESK